jgi:4-amino-4-deoxy-L-arabinose transferase-like glycosyltransferase
MKKPTLIILGIFVLALALRLGTLLIFPGTSVAEKCDAQDYNAIAHNILKGNGFTGSSQEPTQIRAPGYPIFLAGVYAVFGDSMTPVKIIQGILSSLTVVLIFFIAFELFGLATAVLAGIISACYPAFVIYSNILLSETLFMFFFYMFLLKLLAVHKTPTAKAWLLLAVIQGVQTLIRSTTMYLPFILLLLVLVTPDKKRFLKNIVLFICLSTAVISIWTVRNWLQFHAFIPINATAGYGAWNTTLDNAFDGEQVIEHDFIALYPQLKGLPRHQQDAFLSKEAHKYALSHPMDFMRKMLRNLVFLYKQPVGKVIVARTHKNIAALLQAAQYIFLAGFIFGSYAALRQQKLSIVLLLVIFYMTAVHSLVMPMPRLRLPFEPVMIIFFAVGVHRLWHQARKITQKAAN